MIIKYLTKKHLREKLLVNFSNSTSPLFKGLVLNKINEKLCFEIYFICIIKFSIAPLYRELELIMLGVIRGTP